MPSPYFKFQYISDAWFLLDIIFNFRTGIVLDGPDSEVILKPEEIRVLYLKTWFAVDLISTFPFDLIYTLVVSILVEKRPNINWIRQYQNL